ncbi:MAG: hypothetical protein U7123_18220 [Potamolinea sp.]
MNINVNIDRLILEGVSVPVSQRPLLQAAIEAELARLLTADGLASSWQTGGAVPSLSGEVIQLNSDNNPTQLGQQIAQSVYRGMGK